MEPDKKLCNTFFETSKPTNLDSNLIKSDCLKRTLDGLVTHGHDPKEQLKNVQDEKTDISPEISNKKSNDTSPMAELHKERDSSRMNKSFSMQTFSKSKQKQSPDEVDDDKADINRSMAFTIDFGNGKQIDEQRHKNLLERFQNRHRRGVSLSKMEDEMCDSSSSSQLNTKLKSPASARLPRKNSLSREVVESPQKPSSAGGVRLRDKTKASQLKDSSKRHSWSPRSSMVEPTSHQPHNKLKPSNSRMNNPLERPLKLHALTKADVKPMRMPPTTLNITCLQPPLENKESHLNDDQVSEAGTYTLDGDNYTEEQKEKMNIDNLALEEDESELMQRKLEINESDSNVETDLEIIDLDPPPEIAPKATITKNRKNILEVSFYHQEPTQNVPSSSKHKVSYLEKLKSRMKNIGDKKFHKSKSPECDVGTFTSVTTSGVLSMKPTLEINPRLKRKNSLTKSQIDSSEYVQGIQRAVDKAPITDNDKSIAAGYQLNIFPQQSPSKGAKESAGSSNTSISTAATKDDWITEWARNAREFSRHKRQPIAPAMSSSYNFENSREKVDQFGFFVDDVMSRSDCKPQYEEFGDNLEKYHQKSHHHKKPPTPENYDDSVHRQINNLSNHGSLSSNRGRRVLRDFDLNKDEPRISGNFNIKPPISPSRIPSPIGSISSRQKRFGSNKMLYGSETDLANDTELYLQRTAAAISSLQNLQRRNSMRNSSLQNSPVSPMSPTRPPIVQSNKITTSLTPTNVQSRAQSVTRNPIHKRNSSLDSSRFTAGNVMSTSLQSNNNMNLIMEHKKQQQQQQQQQQHSRHNSYDGICPPPRPPTAKYSQFDQTDDDDYESMPNRALPERQHVSIKQQHHQNMMKQQQSPIKRSSSFNVKPQEIPSPARVSGTPKMHNKFMKTVSAPAHGTRIQKSASSSCFKQVTADDDDFDNEFYINDDDDLNPNQFTPSDCSDDDQKFSSVNDPPISNTRYNKTFLMRCEQSKKVAGVAGKQLGVIACPNTPELPRRDMAARSSIRDRASMPRDSSLNRLLDKKPLSAGSASAGKSSGRVTSKYLDISKYKPEKGNNFLKRDETKNYLQREVKKSSSSACLQSFQRDSVRASSRSSGGAGSSSRPSSGSTKKKDVKHSKEMELAMWKRRASYDPLKAAAEGKKKAEEAKRVAQQQQMMMSSESNSSMLRSSKSYHSGAADNWIDDSSSEFDDEN